MLFSFACLAVVALPSNAHAIFCVKALVQRWLERPTAESDRAVVDRLFFRRKNADAANDETASLAATADLVRHLGNLKTSDDAVRHGIGLLLVTGARGEETAIPNALSPFESVRRGSLRAAAALLTSRTFRSSDHVRVVNAFTRTALGDTERLAEEALDALDTVAVHLSPEGVHAAASALEVIPDDASDLARRRAVALRVRLANRHLD